MPSHECRQWTEAGPPDLRRQRNGPELDNGLVQSWAENWSRAGQSTGPGPEKELVAVERAGARIGEALLGWVWVVWQSAISTAFGTPNGLLRQVERAGGLRAWLL